MAVTTLRPNAAGTTMGWNAEGGDYTRVDEASSDGDTTRLYTPTNNAVATFNLDASGLSGVAITAVKVYINTRGLDPISNSVQLAIRTGGTDYFSSTKTYNNTSYHLESATWTINPNTGVSWTISDVDALEAGMKRIGGGGQAVTQVYVEVITASAALAGTLSSGADEADIVAGAGTITLTLTDATFVENGYSADLTTGGTPSASHENGASEGADEAFDDSSSTKWLAFNTTPWLQYRFGSSATHLVLKYSLTSGNDDDTRDPKDWTLQGSNDGSSWTTVDTVTGETFASRGLTKEFICDSPGTTAYEYYRLNISANNGNGSITQLAEMQLFKAGTAFDDIRDDIISGLDSAQSEGTGWDAVVKAGQTVGGVVRTSSTVVTITFDAFASYNITAQETITATIPSAALVDSDVIVASPTFTIDTSGGGGGGTINLRMLMGMGT